ncbi:hypothetical protein [Croceicoccus bisphenolivorans]|uniref:hypothetical protein n=1 Tax=Croceicoccus bisphenolivorans TaxID=1783232 RepID=UPI00082C7C04|nr:hypothetical protein [Croceicoccus bisphenolivorans]
MKRTHAGLALLAGVAVIAALVMLSGMGSGNMDGRGHGFVLLPESGDPSRPGAVRSTDSPGSAGATLGREFAMGLDLAVKSAGPGNSGYVITPRSDAGSLTRHKLRVGDIVMDMDGRPLDAGRIKSLPDELGQLDAVEVSYMRNGQWRNELVTFDRP